MLWCHASPLSKKTIGAWAVVIQTPEGKILEYSGLIPENTTSIRGKFLSVLFSLRKIPDNASVHVFSDYTPIMYDIRTLINQIQTGVEIPQDFGFLDTFVDICQSLKIELNRFHDLHIDWVRWDTDNLHYLHAKKRAELQIAITNSLNNNLSITQNDGRIKQISSSKNIFTIYIPIKNRLEELGFRFFNRDFSRVIKRLFTKEQRKKFVFEQSEKLLLPSDSVLIDAAMKAEIFLIDNLKKPKKECTYQIWCDGSYLANGKIGGWGAIIIAPDGTVSEDSGGLPFCRSSTETELWGITYALENIPDGYSVEIYCDSQSAVTSVQGLAWKSKNVGCITNYKEMIPYLKDELKRLDIVIPCWIKGHGDHTLNNRADKLAGIEARRMQSKKIDG